MAVKFAASPVTKGTMAISWPFLGVVGLLLVLNIASMDVLSAARAFVGAESLWSKGQKQALQSLERYARSGAEEDYLLYERAVAVPLGHRDARLALESPKPDPLVVTSGLVRGGNDPRDVPGMARLFRNFRHYGPVERAIGIWTDADVLVQDFVGLAQQLREPVQSGDRGRALALLEKLYAIDAQLTPYEEQFSFALGEASRQAKGLLLLATLLTAAILTTAGMIQTRRLVLSKHSMAASLEFSEQRLKLAIAASDHGIWDLDRINDVIHVSPHFMAALGHKDWPAETSVSNFLALLPQEDRELLAQTMRALRSTDYSLDVEFRVLSSSHGHRWVRANGSAVHNAEGQLTRLAGALSDITERKASQDQLFEQKERAQVTLQSIGDAVVTTDANGFVDYLNPAAETLLGLSTGAACSSAIAEVCRFIDENSRLALPHPIETALREGKSARLGAGAVLVRQDGGEVALDASAAPICGRNGAVLGMVLVLRDVSRERAIAAKLSYQATHDSVTGLINRREFERRLSLALESARDAQQEHVLLYLDLDQFKIVNDTCGHAAGDDLLRQVASLLKTRLRAGDALARLGGDEFGLLLEHCPLEHALRIAEQLRQAVVECRFVSGDRSFPIGVSIGLVNLDADDADLESVLSAADSACYVAKENGRNRVQVYHPSDRELALRHGMMQWVTRIQEAIDEGRLRLFAQRIAPARAADGDRLHLEVLLRMVERDGRLVPPMAFLPAAERFNLMSAIDHWVVRSTFETLARHAAGTVALCAINLSGISVCDDRFLEFIKTEQARYGITPAMICFEITETAAISNLAKASKLIDELRGLGYSFALDDFGSGMASFGYLKQLPIDYLKIDGSFVKDMLEDPIDCAMVEAINKIGHVMGIKTIAEFVENDAILERLCDMDVDFVQGYGVGKPEPLEMVMETARSSLLMAS
ncbi:EAL domain-containing protein [Variovorax sp. HJSM1_2]|uniref:EAL domain-containing protein n=1 Tax=Variovorax sp. HJSM1_2 TaxID=3366263 RepID=UPI003BC886A4